MLFVCIKTEFMKLRRSFVWLACFVIPVIPAILGTANYMGNLGLLTREWDSLWTQQTLFYGCFFFAPLIAVYCAYLWRVENFGHNRNVLMTSPVPLTCIFLGKLTVTALVTVITQLWVFVLFIVGGKFAGLSAFLRFGISGGICAPSRAASPALRPFCCFPCVSGASPFPSPCLLCCPLRAFSSPIRAGAFIFPFLSFPTG